MESLFRLVSGDYRGFVMIWEVEDIKEELVTLERRVKSLPKNGQSRGEGTDDKEPLRSDMVQKSSIQSACTV